MKLKENRDLSQFPVSEIKMAKENDTLYGRFSIHNFDDRSLVESINERGIQEPLVISEDLVLLSGHRRLSSAKHLQMELVPVRVVQVEFEALTTTERLRTLSEFNQQRDKSGEERINEAFVRIDPTKAYTEIRLRQIRQKHKMLSSPALNLGGVKHRHKIRATQFLAAVSEVISDNECFLPLTVRRVHYLLLNHPPLKHDKKPSSTYRNDLPSYKALANLLTRARLSNQVPMNSIEDITRPIRLGGGFDSVTEYIQEATENFLIGYRRDLQKGQRNHIEIVLEKNALRTVLEVVAEEYCIPMTTARGYVSLPPKAEIATRFRRSGKETLVLLLLTDFDPDGEEIAKSTARSLRDDFRIFSIHSEKVALTADDVRKHNLPSDMDAKKSSTNYKKFIAEFGSDRVVELDAAPVEFLQQKLRDAIEKHMDIDEFNRQLKIEKEDNQHIVARRDVVFDLLSFEKN